VHRGTSGVSLTLGCLLTASTVSWWTITAKIQQVNVAQNDPSGQENAEVQSIGLGGEYRRYRIRILVQIASFDSER
jgi:hypothetical protein